jgi:Holliday junction resolvasome RuvABC endonuclease subunit
VAPLAFSTRTIGIDPSLTCTGISIWGNTSSIRTNLKGVERLVVIREMLMNIVGENNIVAAAIEGYSFASRNSQAHSLGELGGVLRVAFHERSIPLLVVPPTVRAKFATGKGNASKSEVVSAISAMTGIVWDGADGADRCDAWVIEQVLLAKLGESPWQWNKQQLEALAKVEWGKDDGE